MKLTNQVVKSESLRELRRFLEEVGDLARFTARFFRELVKPRPEVEEFFRQCFWVGYKSLPLVGITAFIMGLVLTIQSRPTLLEFGAESLLPAMVAVSLVREISPVITALICAGKIGSGMGAELGSMRVTEQIPSNTSLSRAYWLPR
jgi:phospholipid/cholesterol/gamma-HCH transport system permease protein